MLKCRRSRHFL